MSNEFLKITHRVHHQYGKIQTELGILLMQTGHYPIPAIKLSIRDWAR